MGRGFGLSRRVEGRLSVIFPRPTGGTYPYPVGPGKPLTTSARSIVLSRAREALPTDGLPAADAQAIWSDFVALFTERLDLVERRQAKDPAAEEAYHRTTHAMLQATHDAAELFARTRQAGEEVSSVLGEFTLEDGLAVLYAAAFHDAGHPSTPGASADRNARRIAESQRFADSCLASCQFPRRAGVDPTRLRRRVQMLIAATGMPKGASEQALISALPPKERYLARLVEVADSGGQLASEGYVERIEQLYGTRAQSLGISAAVPGSLWGQVSETLDATDRYFAHYAPWLDLIYGGVENNPFRQGWRRNRREALARASGAAAHADPAPVRRAG